MMSVCDVLVKLGDDDGRDMKLRLNLKLERKVALAGIRHWQGRCVNSDCEKVRRKIVFGVKEHVHSEGYNVQISV
jgi:hypothetical protein